MTSDLATFLVARSTIVDAWSQQPVAPHRPVRRGRRPELSDRDVLTLLVCAPWHGRSERGVPRVAWESWRSSFPRRLDQRAVNRRARELTGATTQVVPRVAAAWGATVAPDQVIDGVGLPLARRSRGIAHRRFGDEAARGRGGVDKDGFVGGTVLLSGTPGGAVTGGVVGPADTEERWLAEAWACWRAAPEARPWDGQPQRLPPTHTRGGRHRGPTGPIWPRDGAGQPTTAPSLADRGDRGAHWQVHGHQDSGPRS